ncbi:MAG: FAD-dependent oxidoreductase [Syntrophobacteraceae bacterium]
MQKQKKHQSNNKVLVVGGGMGGIRAALDLAEAGRDVILIDTAFAIGGLMTKLDRTFPTNNCDLCTLSPHLSESGRALHIELLAMTELDRLEGSVGDFKVTLKTKPRYIDLQKCTACGDCNREFPHFVRFTPGLDHRAPTCMRYPQATPYAFSVDREACSNIDELVKVCPAGAILPDDTGKVQEVTVGAVILAAGAEPFTPTGLDTYGYGEYPNVVTNLEYERILSAAGPTGGELLRPSDSTRPRKVAWIQCVGSRAAQEGSVSYCSSACCMVALKEAIVTRERFEEGIETTIFYMDMRTSGKDYERYLDRAINDYGVRLVRSRPHSIEPAQVNGTLTGGLSISYVPYGSSHISVESFDMAVLSTGFRVTTAVRELATKLGVDLNHHGFARTRSFEPVATSKPGIYVCGLFESPKDIPETMVQASAAASRALQDLSPLRIVSERVEDYPPERSVSDEEPRIGVFICDCGFNIGGVVDVRELAAQAASLPQVVVSRVVGHGCSHEALEHLQAMVRDHDLNRVVMGACSPRTHETLFQDALRKAGLNKYLLEVANLRDQDTWVHPDRPKEALVKAGDLIRMAVSAVRLAKPLNDYNLPMDKGVLVVGGGVAGMTAALSLADMGYRVNLVERSAQLGGMARKIRKTIHGENVTDHVDELIKQTEAHEKIQTLKSAVVVDHSGMAGMFKTGVQTGPQMFYRQIKHGVTILATGALANRPAEYLLGSQPGVVTQLDLEAMLEESGEKVKGWEQVVMIQCVGSRTPENPNCSRVCCQEAVKNAIRIKAINPEAQILVLYRDMRTAGFGEDYYREARELGVIFVPYDLNDKPKVEQDGDKTLVSFTDPILNRRLQMRVDCLALSTGFVADEESTEDLGGIFHIDRTSDGYFLEDHVKLRPVDLSVPGFFVAGTAHAPKSIRESVMQAQAVAARAQTFLSRDAINLGAAVAQVDTTRCASCLICVRACPFDVPFINAEGHSEIDPAKCHGCGVCASECPAKAIQLMQFEDDQILAKLDGLFERMV